MTGQGVPQSCLPETCYKYYAGHLLLEGNNKPLDFTNAAGLDAIFHNIAHEEDL